MDRRNFLKLSSAGLAGLSFPPVAAMAQSNTIVFGGSVPMTGAAAETGLNLHFGYQCAVKYVNEEIGGFELGGKHYKLELNLFDDASDPARAVTLIQRQIDEGVQFFLGSQGSNIVLPTSAATEANGRLMIQGGGASDLIFTQGKTKIFGLFPRASRQPISAVEMFKQLQPTPKKVVIIHESDPFSIFQAEGFRDQLQESNFDVVDYIQLPEVVNDVSNVLASVRSNTPDILICATHENGSLLIARQMVSSDTNVPLLFQTLGPQTDGYQKSLGAYANGVATTTTWSENAAYKGEYFGSASDFAKYFRANFDRHLTFNSAAGAACIVTYLEAFRQSQTLDVEQVAEKLRGIEFECFYGRVKFTPEGDGDPYSLGALVMQIQSGVEQIIAPQAARTATPLYPSPKWSDK